MREGITAYISHEDVVDSDLSKILACKSSPHAKSATLLFFLSMQIVLKMDCFRLHILLEILSLGTAGVNLI